MKRTSSQIDMDERRNRDHWGVARQWQQLPYFDNFQDVAGQTPPENCKL